MPDSKKDKKGEQREVETSMFRTIIDLIVSIGGIYGCFMLMGIFQEKLFMTEYKQGKFTFPFANNVIMCLVGVILNVIISSVLN